MTSDIRTKDNLWQNVLEEIVNEVFATVEIYRRPGWNIFRNLIKRALNKNVLILISTSTQSIWASTQLSATPSTLFEP